MRSALTSYWNFGNLFCGMEVVQTNGHRDYVGVVAAKKKGEFTDFKFLKANSFNELSEELGKNRHAHLVINIDGVLIKETPLEKDPQKAIAKAFPGLSLSDFYCDVYQGQNRMFVAVARKESIEELLKEAENAGIGILSFRLGFGSIGNLIPLLSEESIVASKYNFALSQNQIVSFEPASDVSAQYKLEDVSVSSDYLLATSGLLDYLDNGKAYNEERNASLLKTHIEKNFFRKGLVLAVLIILVSLLVNFFFFTDYRKTYQNLSEQVEVAAEQKERLQLRTEIVEKKEYVVENILNSGHSKSSFFINRITSQRPNSVLFSNIEFQPLLKNVRPDKQISYEKDVLSISGDSYDKEAFSVWIQELESLDWISNVTVIQYGQAVGNSNFFEIKLMLIHDTEK